MIFATVGTQLPFPRMIHALRHAVQHLDVEIIAQTIDTEYVYEPRGRLTCIKNLHPSEFQSLVTRAHIIVSHAGIGSIISAASSCKPIALMPRQSDRAEHRNDHQIDTARRFEGRQGIYVFQDEVQLIDLLQTPLAPLAPIEPDKSPLINGIKSFIWNGN